jgi:hypothetical protein
MVPNRRIDGFRPGIMRGPALPQACGFDLREIGVPGPTMMSTISAVWPYKFASYAGALSSSALMAHGAIEGEDFQTALAPIPLVGLRLFTTI